MKWPERADKFRHVGDGLYSFSKRFPVKSEKPAVAVGPSEAHDAGLLNRSPRMVFLKVMTTPKRGGMTSGLKP